MMECVAPQQQGGGAEHSDVLFQRPRVAEVRWGRWARDRR